MFHSWADIGKELASWGRDIDGGIEEIVKSLSTQDAMMVLLVAILDQLKNMDRNPEIGSQLRGCPKAEDHPVSYGMWRAKVGPSLLPCKNKYGWVPTGLNCSVGNVVDKLPDRLWEDPETISRRSLLEIKGCGPKTADAVLKWLGHPEGDDT